MEHASIEEMKTAFAILRDEGDVSALVLLPKNGKKGATVGYYNDFDKAVEDAYRVEAEGMVCVSLNRLKPELLARSENRIGSKQSVSDGDVEAIDWLFIDIDPVRPAGISSTDEQHEAARRRADEITASLSAHGLPSPVVGDSGNGCHLLYLINLPNDEVSRRLVNRVLEYLDFRFSDGVAQVDRSTGNPGRLIKLPGTVARKGDDLAKHPHRLSRLVDWPAEGIEEVPRETLEQLAMDMPTTPSKKKPAKGDKSGTDSFPVREWLEEHGLEVATSGRWREMADKYILSVCPWNESHTNRSAFVLAFDNGGVAAGCHHDSCRGKDWAALRDALEPGWRNSTESEPDGEEETQAQTLLRLAERGAEFFTNELQEAFAEIRAGDHTERYRVTSRAFRLWLTRGFYQETRRPPGVDAMRQALGVLEAKAIFEGEKRELHVRVAEAGGAYYYDLGDDAWRVVRVTAEGWGVVADPPALFSRNKNMRSQVVPAQPGDVRAVLRHVPLKDEDDQILYLVYLVSCLVPNIPHPVLALSGEKGAAKSTTTKETRALVDPAFRDLLTLPNGNNDLGITLMGNYMVCFDNLDYISSEKSDILCMAVTGGGISKRTLFSDDDETILSFRRCIVLNGINQVATRPDLLDRSLLVELKRIAEEDRKEEAKVRAEFEADLPGIVGGMFTALSQAMALHSEVKLTSLPRMADFAHWGYAIAEALGIGGQRFIEAYENNRKKSNQEAVSAHPVAAAVAAFMQYKGNYECSVADFLGKLEDIAEREKINVYNKSWPKAAHVLTRRLREVESNLKDIGILFEIRNAGQSKRIKLSNLSFAGQKTAPAPKLAGRPRLRER